MGKDNRLAGKKVHDAEGLRGVPEDIGRDGLISEILPYTSFMPCRKGMEVILGGMESRSIYYLSRGSVEVSYVSNDTKIVVAFIGAGQFFGESGFFDGVSRVRNIRSVEDSDIQVINAECLERLKQGNPVLYGHFMALMARSIAEKFRRVLDDREPVAVYASHLSSGKREFGMGYEAVTTDLMESDTGKMIRNLVDNYKSRLHDLSHALQKEKGEISVSLQRNANHLMDEFFSHLMKVETLVGDTGEAVWQYLFKEAFPYVMRSRFAERAYFKPKGYAGDFLMIEMLHNRKPDGDGKLGCVLDAWCLQTPAAFAVRGRRVLLARLLSEYGGEVYERCGKVSIMNMACGPSRELFDYLGACDYSESVHALCVDIDADALEYTHQNSKRVSHSANIRLMSENLIKWCLNKTDQHLGRQDIIYSSGLMDYLDDNLFRAMIEKCYEQLNPGGRLILGNFSPDNPDRVLMDRFLDWKLIYRDRDALLALFEGTGFDGRVEVVCEKPEINLFAIGVKS